MAYTITPSLGADINYQQARRSPSMTPMLRVCPRRSAPWSRRSDGHDYVLAQASGTVASGATVVLTEPAMTFATGAGAWTAPSAHGRIRLGQAMPG
jgi:hypothetical protein